MNKDTVLKQLRILVRQFKSQRAAATALGVSTAHLSEVLNGHAEPGPIILDPLGLERVISYQQRGNGK